MGLKKKVYGLLDEELGNQKGDNFVHYFISALIVINVVILFLESYKEIAASYGALFYVIEVFSIAVFSAEYIARLWTADLAYPQHGMIGSRMRYIYFLLWG